MKLSRPNSIIWFERLFVTSILLSAVRASLNWIETFSSDYFIAEGWTNFVIMQMLATIINFSLDIGLWYFIARRASNLAKWLLIGKALLGLVVAIYVLLSLVRGDLQMFIVSAALIQALVLLSIVFLFRQDARKWLVGEKTVDLEKTFE